MGKRGAGAIGSVLRGAKQTNKSFFFFLLSSHFQLFPLHPPSSAHLSFLPVAEHSWNGAHHELLLASPGRRIDIIKKPIKLRAGAFITVICEGLGLMGCLFPCVGLTAAIVYCWNDTHPPPHTNASISYTPEGNKKPNLTYGSRTRDVDEQCAVTHSQNYKPPHTKVIGSYWGFCEGGCLNTMLRLGMKTLLA